MDLTRPPGPAALATLRAVWSLGRTTSWVLEVVLEVRYEAMGWRLRRLAAQGLLRASRPGPGWSSRLYTVGPRAFRVDAGYVGAWRPPLAQLDHTLAVGRTLVRLVGPELFGRHRVVGWQGEGELRSWHRAGQPLPDLQLVVAGPAGVERVWCVEVDMGTEGRGAWSRKLAGYLAEPAGELVLVTTTTEQRARQIAGLAADAGVPVVACRTDQLGRPGTVAYDARLRRRRPLGDVADV